MGNIPQHNLTMRYATSLIWNISGIPKYWCYLILDCMAELSLDQVQKTYTYLNHSVYSISPQAPHQACSDNVHHHSLYRHHWTPSQIGCRDWNWYAPPVVPGWLAMTSLWYCYLCALTTGENTKLAFVTNFHRHVAYVTWSRGMSPMWEILFLRYWQKQSSNSFVVALTNCS